MAEALVPLLSLVALEVILGIDNIIFISILADRLPDQQRKKVAILGAYACDVNAVAFTSLYRLDS